MTRTVQPPAGSAVRSGQRRPVERRRSAARASSGDACGAITLTVMKAMVAASEALRRYLEESGRATPTTLDLTRPGDPLADHVRHYQSALRQFVKDWLRDRAQTGWLVDASTGRTLTVDTAAPSETTLAPDTEVVLAEDQPQNGLRRRFVREGVGMPVACRPHLVAHDPLLEPVQTTAARAYTVTVDVVRAPDRRLRSVRVRLLDPAATGSLDLGLSSLPLAADFSAPVALTLGLERKPAAMAYTLRDVSRRGTTDGFAALTPFASERAALVLLEGIGLSTTAMAQIANEVAGDPTLSARYQVWLYRYPVAAPLAFAAAGLRADLARFAARVGAATGQGLERRVVVVARGPAAFIARSLQADSGTALWDAVWSVPAARLDVESRDRALLESLLCWRRLTAIERVITSGEPDDAAALIAGVGARAVQRLQRQDPEFRSAVERIHGRAKAALRAAPLAATQSYPEPVCEAVAAAAVAVERAFITLGAGPAAVAAGPNAGSATRRVLAALRDGS